MSRLITRVGRTSITITLLALGAACSDTVKTDASGDAVANAIGDSTPEMTPASSMLANTPTRELEGPTWRLVDMLGAAGARDSAAADADFKFADGRMTGTTGCNNLMAGYRMSGQSIQVLAGASTKKACADSIMKQEQTLLAHLPNIATYVIASDRLYLVSATGDNLLIFAPQPASATP